MYFHKDNIDLFRDVILLTSQKLEISEDIVEKDYYVSLILQKLSKIQYPTVFKGGTSLSKAYKIIDRFSEDIDITFTEYLGAAKRKKLKYDILNPLANELGLEIRNWNTIESDRDYNHYDFYYESVVGSRVTNAIPPFVKLETALMSYSFPTVTHEVGNYLFDVLMPDESDLVEKYNLAPFSMRVQSLSRTLIDKIFAVCDYYLQNKPRRNARHLYDIYKLAPYIQIDSCFMNLVDEVRKHRIQMGIEIAPSAPLNINIPELVQRICEENFYESDYKETTLKLISDSLDYTIVKKFYHDLVLNIFEKNKIALSIAKAGC